MDNALFLLLLYHVRRRQILEQHKRQHLLLDFFIYSQLSQRKDITNYLIYVLGTPMKHLEKAKIAGLASHSVEVEAKNAFVAM